MMFLRHEARTDVNPFSGRFRSVAQASRSQRGHGAERSEQSLGNARQIRRGGGLGVVVESRHYDKKKQIQSEQKRRYITNLPRGKSQTIAQAIRSHWSVESMHWTMDVVFGEDAGRKRRWNAAENFSRLIKVVMSLLRNHKKKTGGAKSMARMRNQAAWDTNALEEILFDVFPSDDTEAACQ